LAELPGRKLGRRGEEAFMSTYPEQLVPETVENLHLPSGAHARIPKAEPFFRPWRGEFAGDTYNWPAPRKLIQLL